MIWGDQLRFSIEYHPSEVPEWAPFLTAGSVFISVAGARREVHTNDIITCIWSPFEDIRVRGRSINSPALFSLTGTQLIKRAYRGVDAWPRAWWAASSTRGLEESAVYTPHILHIGGATRDWILVAASSGERTRVAMADMRESVSRHRPHIRGIRSLIRPATEITIPTTELSEISHAFAEFGNSHPWWEGHRAK